MRREERLALILKKLREEGSVRNNELCKLFNTSEMTIWRDINELEKAGCLKRVFGGAIDTAGHYTDSTPNERAFENTAAKEMIAKKVISLLKNGDRIFFDSGSTCYIIARALSGIKINLYCTTNTVNTAQELCKNQEIKTTIVGGELKGRAMCSIGPTAQAQLKSCEFDMSFVACNAIDSAGNVMLQDIDERSFKRNIIDISKRCYIVCDSSKIARSSVIGFADVTDFKGIITDKGINKTAMKHLEEKGARFIIADKL